MTRRPSGQKQAERRGGDRLPTSAEVAVYIDQPIVGPGQNLSNEGVFFVTEGAIHVRVLVAGEGEREGELIRLESMGEGKLGLAVRFLQTP